MTLLNKSLQGTQFERDIIELRGPDALRFLNGMWTSDFKLAASHQSLWTCGRSYLLDLKAKPIAPGTFLMRSGGAEISIAVPLGRGPAVYEFMDKYLVADELEMKLLPAGEHPFHFWGVFSGNDTQISRIPPLVSDDRSLLFTAVEKDFGFVVPTAELGSDYVEVWLYKDAHEAAFPEKIENLASEDLQKKRILQGVPAWGVDYQEDSLILEFPHSREISFHKGCYIGQEVVARATYRGRMNRGFARFIAQGLLSPGFVYADSDLEKPVGKISSVYENMGLGLLRLRDLENQKLFQNIGEHRVSIDRVEVLIDS